MNVVAQKLRPDCYKLYATPGTYIGPDYMGDIEMDDGAWVPRYGAVVGLLGPTSRFNTPREAASALAEALG